MKPPPPESLPPEIIDLITASTTSRRQTGAWLDARPLVIKAGLRDQDAHAELRPYDHYVYITDAPHGEHVKCTLAGILATRGGREWLAPLPRLFALLAERFLAAYRVQAGVEPEFPPEELAQLWPDAGDRHAVVLLLEDHFGLHATSSAIVPGGPLVWRLSYRVLHWGHIRTLDDALAATAFRAFNDIPADTQTVILAEVWRRLLASGTPAGVTDLVVALHDRADAGPYVYPLRDVGLLRDDQDHRVWLSLDGWLTLATPSQQADLLAVVRAMAAHQAAPVGSLTFAHLATATGLDATRMGAILWVLESEHWMCFVSCSPAQGWSVSLSDPVLALHEAQSVDRLLAVRRRHRERGLGVGIVDDGTDLTEVKTTNPALPGVTQLAQESSATSRRPVAIVVDGPNYINRVLDLGIRPGPIARQLSLASLRAAVATQVTQLLPGLACETVEFVCSKKRFGSGQHKFTDAEHAQLMDRVARETGVYVDIVDIPGQAEKGVDIKVAGLLEDYAQAREAVVLVSADQDYIPTLQRLRRKTKVLVVAVAATYPATIQRDAYATLWLLDEYPALFTYSYPRFHIKDLTLDKCAELLAEADDRHFNQRRIDVDGLVYISHDRSRADRADVRCTFETYCPRNDYVGPRAASNDDHVAEVHRQFHLAWDRGATGHIDYPVESAWRGPGQ